MDHAKVRRSCGITTADETFPDDRPELYLGEKAAVKLEGNGVSQQAEYLGTTYFLYGIISKT